MEGDVGARHPVPERVDVVEVAADRLGAVGPDGLGGGGAPGQRRDGPAVGDSRRMSAPPMKPEPPVTKACAAAAMLRSYAPTPSRGPS